MSTMPLDDSPRPGLHATLTRRPVGLLVIFLTLILIGVIAYLKIPLQLLPGGVSGTRLSVYVMHPGSSAAENEEKVARVIEEQFRTLPNLDNVWSRSGEGSVMLGVAFSGSTNMDLAKAELRDRVERARPQLPDTVDRIAIWSHDDGDLPIMFLALLVRERSAEVDYLIENVVQRKIEAVEGVSRMQIWGLLDDSVRILLDEDKVKAARLDLGQLVRRLQQDNFAQPLGEVTDGGRRFLLRSDMRFRSFEEIEEYPIGEGLRLGDVAHVERVKRVRDRLTRIDGKTAYYGMIQKESSANVVETAEGVRELLESLEDDPKLAGQVGMEIFFDQAKFIQTSLGQLQSTALWGGGLAILVLFMFLRRVRMTLCVALSIPFSVMLAIAYEHFTGGSFNVATMAGLTLGIGMLVDNSVVVMENIARVHAKGRPARTAAVNGVRDVGLAITLATMTTVVVFVPLMFMSSNPALRATLMGLGMPLCTSLVFSLLVALIFLPVVASRILVDRRPFMVTLGRKLSWITEGPAHLGSWVLGALSALFHASLVAVHRLERSALRILTPLRWPLAVMFLVLAAWRLTGLESIEAESQHLLDLGVAGDPGSATVWMSVGLAILAAGLVVIGLPRWGRRSPTPPARPTRLRPEGTSVIRWVQAGNHALLEWTLSHRLMASALALGALATIAFPVTHMTVAAFGSSEETTELQIRIQMEDQYVLEETSSEFERYENYLEGHREEYGFDHVVSRFGTGGGSIELRWDDRQNPEDLRAFRELLRREMPKRAGQKVYYSSESQMDVASRQYIHFQIRGPSADALEGYGDRAVALLKQVPGLSDVSSSLESAPEQIRLSLDSDTAYTYGVSSDAALQSVSWALRGASLPRYQEKGRELAFFIEYDDTELAGLDTLKDLEVFTVNGAVPLASFAKVEFERGNNQIFRWNGQTTFDIQARIANPNRQAALVEAGYVALDALELPRGFTLGRDQSVIIKQREQLVQIWSALALSVVLVFLLMGILFESLLLPFSVLTTIPFAAMGAMWTLYLTGTVMDAIGWVGIIVLVGVVVNNGIVLVDKIHRIRRSGKTRDEAVLQGAAARVRPIMMTALTTVFGLLPMAIGDGVGANEGIDYRALATCVAGGLTFATVFTLWVVPLAYTVIDDVARGLSWLVRRSLHAGPIGDGAGQDATGGEAAAGELVAAGGGAGAARDRETR